MTEKTENFNLTQSSLIKNGFSLQLLAQKYFYQIIDARAVAEKRLKRLKNKAAQLEKQITDYNKEIEQVEPMLKTTVESAINTVLSDFNIKPPYKVHLLYKEGIPTGIRIPEESISTETVKASHET